MAPNEKSDRAPSGLRVLLVEDEIMIAVLLEEMLIELGHEIVGPVARLNRALEVVQREAVDIAILDVNIAGSEVYPVAEALAERGVPYFFVTGYGRAGLRAPYRDSPTLQKPFGLRDLRKLFDEACRARQG